MRATILRLAALAACFASAVPASTALAVRAPSWPARAALATELAPRESGCSGGLDRWSYGAPDPAGLLEAPAVGSDGTYLYAAGGFDGDPLRGTYRYDPAIDRWATLA